MEYIIQTYNSGLVTPCILSGSRRSLTQTKMVKEILCYTKNVKLIAPGYENQAGFQKGFCRQQEKEMHITVNISDLYQS